MCGEYNVRAFAEDNTGQNIDKGHISSPRMELLDNIIIEDVK